MPVDAFELFGTIGVRTSDAESGLARVDKKALDTKKNFDGTEKSAEGLSKGLKGVGKDAGATERNFDTLLTKVKNVRSDFAKGLKLGVVDGLGGQSGLLGTLIGSNPLTGLVSSAVGGAISSVKAEIADLVNKGFEFNSQYRRASLTLTTLGGDAKEAKKQLEAIRQLGLDRAFEFKPLVDAATHLEVVGIKGEQLTSTLKGAVAMTAALGGETGVLDKIVAGFDQMADSEEVAGRALAQMEKQGVPVLETLARKTGLSVKALQELSKAGRINGKAAIRLLSEGWEEEYGKLADDLGKGFNGQMTRFDQLTAQRAGKGVTALQAEVTKRMAQVNAGIASPMGDEIAESINRKSEVVLDALDGMLDYVMDNAVPKFADAGKSLGEELRSGATKALDATGLRDMLRSVNVAHFAQGAQFLQTPKNSKHSDDIETLIKENAARTGVSEDLIRAIIHQESAGHKGAVSPKGARGLMQLMPATAARFGVTDTFDPAQNIRGGTDYLKFLLDKFHGDVSLVAAGYNAGEGAVEKYGNKVPPYRETQNYVQKVMGYMGASGQSDSTDSMAELREENKIAFEHAFKGWLDTTFGHDAVTQFNIAQLEYWEKIYKEQQPQRTRDFASEGVAVAHQWSKSSPLPVEIVGAFAPNMGSNSARLPEPFKMPEGSLGAIDLPDFSLPETKMKSLAEIFRGFNLGIPPAIANMKEFARDTSKALSDTAEKMKQNKDELLSSTVSIRQGLDDLRAHIKSDKEQIKDFIVGIPEGVGDVFVNSVKQWDGTFKGFFRSVSLGFAEMLQDLALQLIKAQITKGLAKILGNVFGGKSSDDSDDDDSGGGGGGFNIGSISGVIKNFLGGIGHHADGGDFSGMKPILVGERGPEVIFPRAGGSVMTNEALRAGGSGGGGGGNIHIENMIFDLSGMKSRKDVEYAKRELSSSQTAEMMAAHLRRARG